MTDLQEKQRLSREAYKADRNRDVRDAVERKFEKLAEAVLDVADQLCKHERGLSTTYRKERICVLEEEGILPPDVSADIQEAIGFRDVFNTPTVRSSTTTSCTTRSRTDSPDTSSFQQRFERTLASSERITAR